MKRRAVILDPDAQEDLADIFEWVAEAAGEDAAARYLDRISSFISGFELGAHRGSLRSDLAPDLRITGFERRLTVAFAVEDDAVQILRVFPRGHDWEPDLKREPTE